MSLGRFRKGYQAGQSALEDQYRTVVSTLRLDPKSEGSAFVSGLKLNLLAIFLWEMIEDIAKGDSLVLASYYLRLAWLLRDARLIETKSPTISQTVHQVFKTTQECWPKIEISEAAALRKACAYYKQGLFNSSSLATVPQEVTVKLIIARLSMKLGRLDEAKRQIIESKSRLTIWEQLHPVTGDNPGKEAKESTRARANVANVELIYEKVEDSLNQQASDKNLRRSS